MSDHEPDYVWLMKRRSLVVRWDGRKQKTVHTHYPARQSGYSWFQTGPATFARAEPVGHKSSDPISKGGDAYGFEDMNQPQF
jgi:hypothetical protein